MSLQLAHLCVSLLICGCCKVSASSGCPDFNNIDVCDDLKHLGRLRVSFGDCNARMTPRNARHEPVVKYDDADEVLVVLVSMS